MISISVTKQTQKINVVDLRNLAAFPNTDYRFANIREDQNTVILERDFLGENALHYYVDPRSQQLFVANSIREIKTAVGDIFDWGRVRAVSNNRQVVFDSTVFHTAQPIDEHELITQLQEMSVPDIDFSNMREVGCYLNQYLTSSITERLATLPKNESVGLLLSGGLDSITAGYFLSKQQPDTRAFTLKVSEDDSDVVKSRVIAQNLGLSLTEVKVQQSRGTVTLGIEVYDALRNLVRTYTLDSLNIDDVVKNTLLIAENPKRDNALCALAMYLIGQVISHEHIKIVFCGEGPNEMINDYGFEPSQEGHLGLTMNDSYFRKALTFGLKTTDMQLGRGGLAKHALSRMGKMFAYYGVRLESPFFTPEIANVMTNIPYDSREYNTIKQHIDEAILGQEGIALLGSLSGISKEKFQDGSGISRIFTDYSQEKLTDIFFDIYGVKKTYRSD